MKISFVIKQTDAGVELLFSGDADKAIEFYRAYDGEGKIGLILNPSQDRSKKNKGTEAPADAPKSKKR